MIRWCLYLRHISGKGYEFLRQSGCLNLPSSRTLRDYTYCNPTSIGFSAATDGELLDVLRQQNLTEDWQKLVILLLDEVYIREEVVYDKHTGQILGLSSLGDINNHLLRSVKFIICIFNILSPFLYRLERSVLECQNYPLLKLCWCLWFGIFAHR